MHQMVLNIMSVIRRQQNKTDQENECKKSTLSKYDFKLKNIKKQLSKL